MKCRTHHAEAIAVCTYCGCALCPDCAKVSESKRTVCSAGCDAALTKNDQALQLILQKNLQNARASAFYSFLCAGLSGAAAVGAHFFLPSPFLIYFTAGCSVVFVATGIWYGRIARRQN